MQFALQILADARPVAAQILGQIPMLFPVTRDTVVDHAGALVENFLRIAVVADRRINGLPDVPLFGRAAAIAEGEFVGHVVGQRDHRTAEIVTHRRLCDALVRAFPIQRVRIVVQIDVREGMEIDRIRTRDERTVVEIRMHHLHGERFPAAGRSAVDEPRPARAERAEFLFDRRNQFLLDRAAIRTDVERIDRVRIVVKRIRVLQFHDQHAREILRGPLLVEPVRLFLLDAVVAVQMETFAVVGLEVRIRWRGAEAIEIRHEMIMEDDQRKM